MTKRKFLKTKGVKIHKASESLFSRGGTVEKDYIIVNEKK